MTITSTTKITPAVDPFSTALDAFLLGEGRGAMGRNEIERLWRSRLQDAQLRLAFARSYVAEVGKTDAAEYERAMQAESVARADYVRVLRAFTDLGLAGIIPDEDECRKAAGDD